MSKPFNIKIQIHFVCFLIFFLAAMAFQSCAPVAVKVPSLAFNDLEIRDILLSIKTQNDAVHDFFSSGRIRLKGPDSELEANVLILGTRDPFRLKIEVTHFWGRPVSHILITKTRLQILSFREKKYYYSQLSGPDHLNLLPMPVDMDMLWAMGRGFSVLSRHHGAISGESNLIFLLNETGNPIQEFEFYPGTDLPHQVSVPDQGLKLTFFDYINQNKIQYARKTQIHDLKSGKSLALNIKQIVFNRPMEESIFELSVPPNFETIPGNPILDTQ